MCRRVAVLIFMCLLLITTYGCVALVAGAAGGAGTAVWLSGKLSQEVNAPYEHSIDAAKSALESLKLKIIKESREENIAQIRSKYSDGKEIWIDVRRVTDSSSKIEVRVGAVSPDKEAADKILKRITRYL